MNCSSKNINFFNCKIGRMLWFIGIWMLTPTTCSGHLLWELTNCLFLCFWDQREMGWEQGGGLWGYAHLVALSCLAISWQLWHFDAPGLLESAWGWGQVVQGPCDAAMDGDKVAVSRHLREGHMQKDLLVNTSVLPCDQLCHFVNPIICLSIVEQMANTLEICHYQKNKSRNICFPEDLVITWLIYLDSCIGITNTFFFLISFMFLLYSLQHYNIWSGRSGSCLLMRQKLGGFRF
jgi:hypothetical protein